MVKRLSVPLLLILLLSLTSVALASEGGWTAQYWNNPWQKGAPVLTRMEAAVNYDWGGGAPAAGVENDYFSARWEQTLYPKRGHYYFTVRADDGVRLWLNDELVVNEWEKSGESVHTAAISHHGGALHIKMDFRESVGVAKASLDWGLSADQSSYVPPAVPISAPPMMPQPSADRPPMGNTMPQAKPSPQMPPMQQHQPTNWGTAVIYNAYYLNLRGGPGMDYPVVYKAHNGDRVDLIGVRYGKWIQVHHPEGGVGWVNEYYLASATDFSHFQTWRPPAMPMPQPMPQQPMPGGPQPSGPQPMPGGQTQMPKPPSGDSAMTVYITNVGVLNMRGGPGLDHPIVRTVAVGTPVSLTGQRDPGSSWVQIRHPDGTFGWVRNYYLTANHDYVIITPTASHSYPQGYVASTAGLHVRSGPGVGYSVVGLAYYGDKVSIMGDTSADGSWMKVMLGNGTVGWVASYYIGRS